MVWYPLLPMSDPEGLRLPALSPAAQQRLDDFQRIADLGDQGLLVTDAMERRFIACNPSACTQLGYSAAELLELSPELIQADPDHDAAWVQRQMELLLRNGGGRFETAHRSKDGSIVDVWVNHTLVSLDGRPVIVSLVSDRTQERYRELQMQELIGLHEAAERISGLGAWTLRVADGRLRLSALAREICRCQADAAKLTLWSLTALIHRDDRSRWRSDLRRSLGRADALQGRYRLEFLDGQIVTVQLEAQVVLDDDGRPLHLIGTIADVSHDLPSEDSLEAGRLVDPLTRLPNKQACLANLERRLRGRSYGNSLAVMALDIDGFQEINDSFGTDVGDQLLVATASRLRSLCGEAAEIGRISSDEFLIVVDQGVYSLGDAMQFARKLQAQWMQLSPLVASFDTNPSFCLGLVSYPEHAQHAEMLLQSAGTALMQAKRNGRGQIYAYSSTLSRQIRERLQLSGELAQAIAAEQLTLQIQPQFTSSGMVVGGEVLLRWTNNRGVVVPPSQFIAIAEQSGQVFALGRWVLRHTLQQIQRWQVLGLPVPRLAINLSARELDRSIDQLLGGLASALADYQVNPEQLELEITETALVSNPLQARQKLSWLADQGFQIAIDDFGTGYSSLELLRSLPIHRLKIDKTFIDGLGKSAADDTIVESILTLARGLQLDCIAEGVERPEQLQRLQELGCELIQGYLFSRPLELEAFTELLQGSAAGGVASVQSAEGACTLEERPVLDPASRLPSPSEQMELLRGAVELSQSCYMLLRAERAADGSVIDFLIVDLNQAACEYLQQGKEAFVGQLLLSVFPGITATGLLEIYANAVLTGQPVALDNFAYPNHELFKDDRIYDVSVYPNRGYLVLDWHDVTARNQMNRSLADAAGLYRLLAENIVEVVVLLDRAQVVQWVSPSLQPMTGWTPLQWQQQRFSALFASGSGTPTPVDLEQWMAEYGDVRQDRLRLKEPNGSWSWVAISARRIEPGSAVRSMDLAAGAAVDGVPPVLTEGYVLTLQPVDEQVLQEQNLLRLAHRDPLTGLESRGAVLEWLNRRLADERGLSKQPVALLFCDVDNFKQINDSYGHAGGDAVLQAVARRIQGLIRHQDHAGRLGGDEVLVVLEGVKSAKAAMAIAEKLRLAVSEPLAWGEQAIVASLSIGVATHGAGEDADLFLRRADRAMYTAKHGGRNRVVAL